MDRCFRQLQTRKLERSRNCNYCPHDMSAADTDEHIRGYMAQVFVACGSPKPNLVAELIGPANRQTLNPRASILPASPAGAQARLRAEHPLAARASALAACPRSPRGTLALRGRSLRSFWRSPSFVSEAHTFQGASSGAGAVTSCPDTGHTGSRWADRSGVAVTSQLGRPNVWGR